MSPMRANFPNGFRFVLPALAMGVFLFLLAPVDSMGGQESSSAGGGPPNKTAPAATVQVEVRESQDKKGVEVKVQAETDPAKKSLHSDKSKDALRILPSAEEKITPVETEKIDLAAEKVTKKLDEMSTGASRQVGAWINVEVVYGISWFKLLASLAILLTVALLERFIRKLIDRKVRPAAERARDYTGRDVFFEALKGPLSLFIWVYGLYAAVSPLVIQMEKSGLTPAIKNWAVISTELAGTVAVIWFLLRLVRLVDLVLVKSHRLATPRTNSVLVMLVGRTLRILILILGGIIVVQNLTGVELGPLLASLGLGGLAVALAAKDSIANFFGTLTIIFDRPFQVGERIILEKYDGVVESIGLRSTRIRTMDGHLISVPNQKAVSSGVENVGRRGFIRWNTRLGISYQTPPHKVEKAVNIVRAILEDHEGMNPNNPPRVYFNSFNPSNLSIDLTAWYYPAYDYWKYQDWVQRSCLAIIQRFDEEGIQFAPLNFCVLENR